MRLETENKTFFAGKHKTSSETFFTNSADILIEKTQKTINNNAVIACGNLDNLFVNLPLFISFLQSEQHHFSTPLPLSNSTFVHVGLDKQLFGGKLVLCEDKAVEKTLDDQEV